MPRDGKTDTQDRKGKTRKGVLSLRQKTDVHHRLKRAARIGKRRIITADVQEREKEARCYTQSLFYQRLGMLKYLTFGQQRGSSGNKLTPMFRFITEHSEKKSSGRRTAYALSACLHPIAKSHQRAPLPELVVKGRGKATLWKTLYLSAHQAKQTRVPTLSATRAHLTLSAFSQWQL